MSEERTGRAEQRRASEAKEGESMRGEQKTAKAGCLRESTVEPEGNGGARSMSLLENGERGGAPGLLERVLNKDNLNRAYQQVKRSGGSPGIDRMTVEGMLPYLKEHGEKLVESLRNGTYKPQPVKRVEIPKADGGKRQLGVPTVIDRMVQQAVAQVLEPIFEKVFSQSSYGFRPGRNCHQAIRQAKEYYEQGYTHVVDIDLAKYFDTVNHDILIGMIREQVKDERVIRLIRSFLKSGVMERGIYSATEEGTPQGGNLSPLLSNIYLTSFDRLLEARGHKFVRYADDCNIYVKSRRAAERVMESCRKYLEGKLKLKVNEQKSEVGSPTKRKFLGFSLYKVKGKTGIRIHEKPLERFKERIREITSRRRGNAPMEQILLELRRYTTGWLGYYAIADMRSRIQRLNEWIRRRIRQIFWKRWKRIRTKHDNLVKLGIDDSKAWEWANTRKAYWRTAGSWILSTSLTNKYLESIGYMDVAQRYEVLHSTR